MTLHVDPAALVDVDDIDARVLASLRISLGTEVANSWFCRLRIESIEGRRVVVSLPTNFLKTWVTSRYAEALRRALRGVEPAIETVEVVVRSAARVAPPRPERPVPALVVDNGPSPKPPAAAPRAKLAGESLEHIRSSSLDRRLTFATFQVGRSNELASAAAQTVASQEAGVPPRYNPLFVHGQVGLGKTHLLQAIAHGAAPGCRVLYLSAEAFLYGFAVAMKGLSRYAMRERLHDIDILLLDDAQFLQGRAVQIELANTIDALLDAGKQIVVASDRPPVDLENLDARLRSRLAGGLCVEVGPMDRDVRGRIVVGLADEAAKIVPGFALPSDVAAYVADVVQTSGRDLAGAVNRLRAHAGLMQVPLTVESAAIAIRDLVRQREPKRVKIEDIQKLVATHFNVSRTDILSTRRTANVVRPRQIAMYLSKVLTLRSLPEIGRRFGGRDHTTVLHAMRKIEGLASADEALRDELRTLKSMLED